MAEFKDLWRGHPLNQSVAQPCVAGAEFKNLEGRTVHQFFPSYDNQCAIRMGIAMRRAGIAPLGGTTCGAHPATDMHYINATDLAGRISGANIPGFGPREVYQGPDYYKNLFGHTGVMFIKDYWRRGSDGSTPTGDHIDVWNGYRSSAKWLMEWFSWAGYYSNYAGSAEVWFWKVK